MMLLILLKKKKKKKKNLPGMLLLIDLGHLTPFHAFFYLMFCKFGEDFKNWLKIFYKNIQSCVIVNGHLSDWFYLQRGCRPGNPCHHIFLSCMPKYCLP